MMMMVAALFFENKGLHLSRDTFLHGNRVQNIRLSHKFCNSFGLAFAGNRISIFMGQPNRVEKIQGSDSLGCPMMIKAQILGRR